MRTVLLGSFLIAFCCAVPANAIHPKHCGCACRDTPCCAEEEPIYDAREITCYKTEFVEVREQKMVPAVKYVPETEYRMVCTEGCPNGCPQAGCRQGGCAKSSGCAPEECGEKAPEICMQKVPITVYRPVEYQKPMEVVQLVEKTIPYTITCYVPRPCSGGPSCGK